MLVWIYGGGFSSGGSAVPIYDGEAMAKKGIVFVSINYRVGVFGFFAHPELTKESCNSFFGKLWIDGSDRGIAMGAEKYCCIWW